MDFLDIDGRKNFDGLIVEGDGQLVIAGRLFRVINGTATGQIVSYTIDLRARTLSSQALTPAAIPNAGGGGTGSSRDARCMVGFQDSSGATPYHALRWAQATGPVDLGTLDPANNTSRSSFAQGVSDDCSVVVGISDTTSTFVQHAFRWSAAGGLVGLTPPAGAARSSRAFGVSADGSVVVGDAEFTDAAAFTGFRNGAYRWSGGTFQALGALGAGLPSSAFAVTADGTTIVGQATSPGGGQAPMRWTQASGMVSLGTLPGVTHAIATTVSDNGGVVAGTTSTSGAGALQHRGSLGFDRGSGAFRWTAAGGMRDLRQLLIDTGADMSGVTLVSVSGMSADGQWITGQAVTPTTPSGETRPYIVQYCDDAIGAACSDASAAPAYTAAAASTSFTVSAGQSASTTLTLTPRAGFTDPISLACSGLPRGAACSFTPATLTPAGTPLTSTLTITTDGGPVAALGAAAALLAPMLALAPLALLAGGGRPRRRRNALVRFGPPVLLVLALIAAAVAAGCGGGGGGSGDGGGTNPPPATGTPAGTSTLTVTASSGSGAAATSTTVQLTLTVTR